MDRITVAGSTSFQPSEGYEYMENNCIEEPTKLCEFKKLTGRILKTVDSVYQDVGSVDECRELCLNSPYRCHSYDYGDTGEMVCRLSHHSRATLSDIQVRYGFFLCPFSPSRFPSIRLGPQPGSPNLASVPACLHSFSVRMTTLQPHWIIVLLFEIPY